MALLAEQRFEEIGLAEVAGRAGLKLSELRAEFGSTLAIVAAHIKDIDREVLAGDGADMAEEPARERLFDVLMRRLEALAPYKEAVRSLLRSARRNPGLALALNAMAVRSQQWMLEAAGIGAAWSARRVARARRRADVRPRAATSGSTTTNRASTAPWPRSAAALASAERWDGFVGDLCAIPCAIRGRRRRRRPSSRRRDDHEAEACLNRYANGRPQAAHRAIAERDVAAVRARDVARDRQPQAGAALVLIARIVEPQERLEHFLAHVRRECRARRHPP